MRKVRHAGAREGGRRGAPRRRRATCTCYVAAASAHAAWAGVWGVTRGKRGWAGCGAGVCARRGCGHLRAPRRARTPASGALAGARVGPGGGRKTCRAPRAQSIYVPTKQRATTPPALPARRNVPRKRPPAAHPSRGQYLGPPGRWMHPLDAPFNGRDAVERGARCAKFAASFHRGPWEEGDRVGRTGRHLRDAFARPQDGAAPSRRRTPVTVRLNGRHCPPSMLIVFVNRPVNVEREGEVEREPAVSHFFRPAHPSPPRAHPPRRLAEDTGGLPRG